MSSEISDDFDGPDPSDSPTAVMADLAVWENWREYWQLIRWLIPDVYRHARSRVLGLVVLSSVGVGARAATIGSMLLYINARATGEPLVLLGVTLPTDASAPVFLMWGTLALAFAALTIAASYRANVVTFDLAQSYAEMAVRRLVRHRASGGSLELPDLVGNETSDRISSMLRGDTNRLVRVVVLTLGVLLPLITLIAALSVLVWTNWFLTLALVPVGLGYAFGLGMLNRGVLRDTQKRTFAGQNQSREVRAMLRTLSGTRYPAGSEPEWLETYPHRTWLQEHMGAFRRLILARRRVMYLTDAFQGVGLLLVVLVFGGLVADEGTSWAILLTYLMALGYATRSLGRVSATVTAGNRFMPQVRRYVLFMQMHPDGDPAERDPRSGLTLHFEAAEPRIPGSAARLDARPGDVVWAVWNQRLDAQSLCAFCVALAGGDRERAQRIESELFFLGRIGRLPERPLRSYLPTAIDDESGVQKRIDDFLEATGVREEFEANFDSLDRVLTHELDESLSPELRYVLRLLPGMLSNPHLYILNLAPLAELEEESLYRVLSSLADRVVIVVSRGRRDSPISGIAGVIVADDAAIRGIGDKEWHANIEWPEKSGDAAESEWAERDDADEDEDDEEASEV